MRIKVSDGREYNIPNNPLQAYIKGRQHGSQEQMDKVAMALMDKAGWHAKSEGPEDRMSIEWLYNQIVEYTEAINEKRISRRDIKEVLRDEAGIRFVDDEVK